MAVNLFWFFIFPGLLFMAVVGGLLSWFDRKITARVQFRKGPPLLQPFYDGVIMIILKRTMKSDACLFDHHCKLACGKNKVNVLVPARSHLRPVGLILFGSAWHD